MAIFLSYPAPNGLIAHLFGPIEGHRHDGYMFGESDLITRLAIFQKPIGEPNVFYVDPAYGIRTHILAPFSEVQLTNKQQELNCRRSKKRT